MVTSYDNYAVSLAGYLVEVVTGVPFDQYVAAEVFAPLGMASTTLSQPPPASLAEQLARGYLLRGDTQVEVGGQYGHDAPAGAGTISTVTDMSRFMLAHLGDGQVRESRVLSETSARAMRERQFSNDERLAGLGLTFFELFHGAHRVVEHGGDSPGFHTFLALLPDQGAGIFVAVNGDGTGEAAEELALEFIDHFYPSPPSPPGPELRIADLTVYQGSYRSLRISGSDASKAFALLLITTVAARSDGTLEVDGTGYRPVGPDLFESGDGHLLAFRRDASGVPRQLFFGQFPAESYQRLSWYQDPRLHLMIIGAALLLMLGTLFCWLIPGGYRRLRGRRPAPAVPRPARAARIVAGGAAAATLTALATLAGLAAFAPSVLVEAVLTGGSLALAGPLALLSLSALATLAAFGYAVALWRHRWWTLAHRLHYIGLAATLATFLTIANYYHLLGWPVVTQV